MKYLVFIFLSTLLLSCDSSKLTPTSDTQFKGIWKFEGRGMLNNIEVEIKKDDKGNWVGLAKKLNDDKYVNMFMTVGDVVIPKIKRNSNFEFVVTEKKVAAALFATYGQSSSVDFTATFKDKNTILLGNNGTSGQYVRVK